MNGSLLQTKADTHNLKMDKMPFFAPAEQHCFAVRIEKRTVQRPHSSGVLCGSFVVCVGDVGVCFRLNRGLTRMPRITRIRSVFLIVV